MRIGILREEKIPEDNRVVLTPLLCKKITEEYDQIKIIVQPSPTRAFEDIEYQNAGIELKEDLGDCDLILGVKEVPKENLIPNKSYCFFSHTIKKQPYNKTLLQTILRKRITLYDYETMVDDKGFRVIAFGRWAGIVGCHNGLWTWGKRTKNFDLKRAHAYKNFEAMKADYKSLELPPIKIVVTGNGRVAQGALEILKELNIQEVTPENLSQPLSDHAVFSQLKCEHLYLRKSDNNFDLEEFYDHPELYYSTFDQYTSDVDLFINAIYWHPKAPAFFSLDEMKNPNFKIKVIADITCDIAPEASVPSTLRPSTISDPVYGFDVQKESEVAAFQNEFIDVMAVDNLPNELSRDASESFGDLFLQHVLPEFLKEKSDFLDRTRMTKDGQLTEKFSYLSDYVAE